MNETNWIPAVGMLLAGIVIGLVALLASRRRSADPARPVGDELELRRDALLEELRRLEESPETAGRRRELELETASILREIDQNVASTSEAPVANPALRGFLWGVGVTTAIGVLLVFVYGSMAPRDEGGLLTGNLPPGSEMPADHPQIAELRAVVDQNPENHDARLDLAYALLMGGDLMGAFRETQHVLDRETDHPRALAYQALVRLSMGQEELAEEMIRRALERDPDLIDGWIHLSLVQTRTGRFDEAIASIEEARRRHPEQAAMLQSIVREIEAQRQSSAQVAGEGTATSGETEVVRGAIEIDPSIRGAARPGAIVFITARAAGVTTGPPAAAKRVPADALPTTFSISQADSMVGQALPAKMRIEARLDADGNAMTRETDDPVAVADGVEVGDELRLTLRRPQE